ncbi:MAG: FeoB-associated Cys-rich membrane protein [Oscillospiraceae bacterium]|nr:FeoB-associated Cys-rich membrane protein [Oscillospiraceae bacterium]
MTDIVILAAVIAAVALIVIRLARKKTPGCPFCTGDCPGCEKGRGKTVQKKQK